MANVLLTFLGRVPLENNRRSYRKTRYDFGEGRLPEEAAFFGWPLRNHLVDRGRVPDRLVILGTAGSMWDHLFEGDLALGEAGEEARLALLEAVDAKAVTAEHLAPLAPVLTEALGCTVSLVLIPYCRDEAEQARLLAILADEVNEQDRVDLDVTHGFRHLPMLALLAALQLRSVRRATVEGIWYGAFDPDTGAAPVHNLVGLLHLADWIQALHTYDKDGDYGVFSPLLGSAGNRLREAAFFERTSNVVKAREQLTTWSKQPDPFPSGDPAAELFRAELERRIAWYRAPDRAEWEARLARQYLDREDFVRAAIYGHEARISAKVSRTGGNLHDYTVREQAREALKAEHGFRALGRLRNALAHGVLPEDAQTAKIVRSPKKLAAELNRLLPTADRNEARRNKG